jgi:hypothetical protein
MEVCFSPFRKYVRVPQAVSKVWISLCLSTVFRIDGQSTTPIMCVQQYVEWTGLELQRVALDIMIKF